MPSFENDPFSPDEYYGGFYTPVPVPNADVNRTDPFGDGTFSSSSHYVHRVEPGTDIEGKTANMIADEDMAHEVAIKAAKHGMNSANRLERKLRDKYFEKENPVRKVQNALRQSMEAIKAPFIKNAIATLPQRKFSQEWHLARNNIPQLTGDETATLKPYIEIDVWKNTLFHLSPRTEFGRSLWDAVCAWRTTNGHYNINIPDHSKMDNPTLNMDEIRLSEITTEYIPIDTYSDTDALAPTVSFVMSVPRYVPQNSDYMGPQQRRQIVVSYTLNPDRTFTTSVTGSNFELLEQDFGLPKHKMINIETPITGKATEIFSQMADFVSLCAGCKGTTEIKPRSFKPLLPRRPRKLRHG